MTTPKVTLSELIEEYKIIADQGVAEITRGELMDFFAKALEVGVPADELRKAKARIMLCWVNHTWADAKKRNPHWSNKGWWERRVAMVNTAFGAAYKAYYTSEAPARSQASKPSKQELRKREDELDKKAGFVEVTSIEEWNAIKTKRAANGNG